MDQITFTVATVEGEIVPATGLLVEFINTKMASYVEPTRKGSERGAPIGMKARKYLATLLALTNIRVKDQAAQLKIHEKLLGVWRTERPFQMQRDRHRFDFNCIRGDFLKEYCKRQAEAQRAAMELPLAEYAEYAARGWEEESWPDEFRDMFIYHEDLLGDLDGNWSASNDPEFDRAAWLVGRILKRRFLGLPPLGSLAAAQLPAIQSQIIDEIKAILLKDEITDADRKEAIFNLEFLRPDKESPRPATKPEPRAKKGRNAGNKHSRRSRRRPVRT